MHGTMYLEPDSEPYESGKEEDIDMEVDSHVCARYCEKCEKIVEIWQDD